jgi:hypothetical protein
MTTVALIILAAIALAATLCTLADLHGRRIASRLDAAYDAGYAEGKAVAGRALNPVAYGRLGATR